MDVNQLRFVKYGAVLCEADTGRVVWKNAAAASMLPKCQNGMEIRDVFEEIPGFGEAYEALVPQEFQRDFCLLHTGNFFEKPQMLFIYEEFMAAGGKKYRLMLFEPVNDDWENGCMMVCLKEINEIFVEFRQRRRKNISESIDSMLKVINKYYGAEDSLFIHLDSELNIRGIKYQGTLQRSELKMNRRLSKYWKPLLRTAGSEFYNMEELEDVPMMSHLNDIKGRDDRNFMFISFHNMMDKVLIVENMEDKPESLLVLDVFRHALERIARLISIYDAGLASSINKDSDIYLQFIDGFAIHSKKGVLKGSQINSAKCCNMLMFLVYNRGRNVSIRSLSEALWPQNILEDPYNVIKGIAFRSRKVFADISDDSLIVAAKGSYTLNPGLNFITDFDMLDDLYRAFENGDRFIKVAVAEKMLEVFNSRILPEFDSEYWLIPIVNKYENYYRRVILNYIELLDDTGDYQKIADVISKALEIVRMDEELHFHMVRVLVKQSKYDMARSYYANSRQFFGREKCALIEEMLRSQPTEEE